MVSCVNSLDFRDVFSQGMFYTDLNGSVQIAQGVLTTNDTQLFGSAGDMAIRGSTDLETQSLNYELTYAPKVTSSLPVILAWMVNPPSGLAALLLTRCCKTPKLSHCCATTSLVLLITLSFKKLNETAALWTFQNWKKIRRQTMTSPLLSAIQLSSFKTPTENLALLERLLEQLPEQRPQLVVVPEAFSCFGAGDRAQLDMAEPVGNGPVQQRLSELAKQHEIYCRWHHSASGGRTLCSSQLVLWARRSLPGAL